jgi:tetratricopeptide (TPR) repeat protein
LLYQCEYISSSENVSHFIDMGEAETSFKVNRQESILFVTSINPYGMSKTSCSGLLLLTWCMPAFQNFDSSTVNKHHCVINANHETLKFLADLKISLNFLEKSKYTASENILLAVLEEMDSIPQPSPAHWVVLNAIGVTLLLKGRYEESDGYLRRALSKIETLSKQGLSQDAYADIAGCLGDIAVNNLKSKRGNEVEAFYLLKRALFMSERAYRPNAAIVENSHSLLALAAVPHDLQKARELAHKMLDSNSTMQEFLLDRDKTKLGQEGAARSLGILAAVLTETDAPDAAIRVAAAARNAVRRQCGDGSVDHARAMMTLARAHFLDARRCVPHRAPLRLCHGSGMRAAERLSGPSIRAAVSAPAAAQQTTGGRRTRVPCEADPLHAVSAAVACGPTRHLGRAAHKHTPSPRLLGRAIRRGARVPQACSTPSLLQAPLYRAPQHKRRRAPEHVRIPRLLACCAPAAAQQALNRAE